MKMSAEDAAMTTTLGELMTPAEYAYLRESGQWREARAKRTEVMRLVYESRDEGGCWAWLGDAETWVIITQAEPVMGRGKQRLAEWLNVDAEQL